MTGVTRGTSAAAPDPGRARAAAGAREAIPGEPVEQVILRRGSTRRFDPAAVLPAEALTWAMTVATRPIAWDAGPSLLEHRLLVHAVEGTRPGLYRWDGAGGRPEPLAAGGLADAAPAEAVPAEALSAGGLSAGGLSAEALSAEVPWDVEPAGGAGTLRDRTGRLCMFQELGHDAAYVAVHCADIEGIVDRLGPRGYRAAQFEAGVVEGRLHLALFTLGYGATGLTFIDELVPAVTGGPPAMLVTAAGKPAYQAVPGGPPLRPVHIRG